MKKILFVVLILPLLSFGADTSKKLIVDVSLSPAGSFTITSSQIKGKVYLTNDGKMQAKKIKIPIKTLKTGIELRDNHLKKKLGQEIDKNAALLLIEANGSAGNGKAIFLVLNKKQTVNYRYTKLSNNRIEAMFSIKLDEFNISGINYMGVGVENTVQVKVIMPYKTKN
ncbi:MAG: hypothetical protein OEW87_15395 [Flavobacteriaceae bacterium]|nr:hypothetical protein [Flavobacteriaceae bacterium]